MTRIRYLCVLWNLRHIEIKKLTVAAACWIAISNGQFFVENCHTKVWQFLHLGLDFVPLLYYNEHCKQVQRKAGNNEDL